MKELEVSTKRSTIPSFPYQLIKWQASRYALDRFLENFTKYNEEHKAVVVKSPSGFSIFTTGELIIDWSYQAVFLKRKARLKE